MAERGTPHIAIRTAALARLAAHASTSALTATSSRPASWPASGSYVILTNFRDRAQVYVGLDGYEVTFFTMTFARAKKGATDPDVLALTNDSLVHEAFTNSKLTLTGGEYASVSLQPDNAQEIASEDDAYNYSTVARQWHAFIDYTP